MSHLKKLLIKLALLLPFRWRTFILKNRFGQAMKRSLIAEYRQTSNDNEDLRHRLWLLEQTVDSLLDQVLELNQNKENRK
jgi:hypothetical protein